MMNYKNKQKKKDEDLLVSRVFRKTTQEVTLYDVDDAKKQRVNFQCLL